MQSLLDSTFSFLERRFEFLGHLIGLWVLLYGGVGWLRQWWFLMSVGVGVAGFLTDVVVVVGSCRGVRGGFH